MQINYHRTTLAKLSMRALQGSRGLGHGRMVAAIDVHHTTHLEPGNVAHPRVVHFAGELHQDGSNWHLADLTPATLVWDPKSSEDTVHMGVSMSTRTLDLLNESRKTSRDDIHLSCQLRLNVDGPSGWQQMSVELRHRVSASDWLQMLAGLGHSTFAVIEVPIGGAAVPPGLAAAAQHFEYASAKLAQCDWDGAIADARQVWDEIKKAIGATEVEPAWAEFDQPPSRTSWMFDQRLAAMRMLARHTTHGAHHGAKERTAAEARYVVGMAGQALKYYAEKLRT
jgi:hypothetical protein